MADQKVSKQFLIESEYIKCKNDPAYFIMKYVYIQNSKHGRSLFEMYEFQKKLLALIRRHDRLCILKSRQLGITTLASAYALWLFMFVPDTSILCMAPTGATAVQIIEKFKFALDNMPDFLITKCNAAPKTFNKTNVVGSNGSKIASLSGKPDAARGRTANLVIFDEMAFVERDEEVFAAVSPTLATGGTMIMLSSPNGDSNFFARTYKDAEVGVGEFIPVKLPWQVHPERDQAWRDKQDKDMGKRLAAQECDAVMLSSGNTYFEEEHLKFVDENIQEPIYTDEDNNALWVWKKPFECGNCMIIVDTALGDGQDNSTIQVLDLLSFSQVAEYMGQRDPKALADLAIKIANNYNQGLLVIENTGLGETTCSHIRNHPTVTYNNLYWTSKGNTTDTSAFMQNYTYVDETKMKLGFTTSTATRMPVLNSMKSSLNDKSLIIRSKRTRNEMGVFIWNGQKPQAKRGYHDDLIMPLAIGCYLRDAAINHAGTNNDMVRAALSSVQRGNVAIYKNTTYNSGNPMTMLNPYTGEIDDISWVLG